MAKKVAKKAKAKSKQDIQYDKPDPLAVKEYSEKFWAWNHEARKVRAAREFIKLVGGYKEAYILLDAVQFCATLSPYAQVGPPELKADDPPRDSGEDVEFDARIARVRKVVTAEKLIELAGGPDEIISLLGVVMAAEEGNEGYKVARDLCNVAGAHHEAYSKAAEVRC